MFLIIGDVIIRTNGGKLVVDAASDTVHHYGALDEADVQNIAEHSYHEYGAVSLLMVGEGHIDVEEGAFVLKVTGDMTKVTISTNAQVLKKNEEAKSSLKISSTKQMEAFRDAVNGGVTFNGYIVELTSDIRLNDGWTPINGFEGTFDGKEHTISNLNAKGISVNGNYNFGLFGSLSSECAIKDVLFVNSDIVLVNNNKNDSAINVGFVAGYADAKLTISGITIESSCSINVTSKVCAGSIVGRWKNGSYTSFVEASVTNCHNKANIVCVDDQKQSVKAAGIVGFKDEGNIDINFDDCSNEGSINGTSGKAVYIAGIVNTNKWENILLGHKTNVAAYKPYQSASTGNDDNATIKYVNTCYNIGKLTANCAETKMLSVLELYTSGGKDINCADLFWYPESIDEAFTGRGYIPSCNGSNQKNGMASVLTKKFAYNDKPYTIKDVETSEDGKTISLTIKED